MRSVANKKTWLAMAALATAVAISPRAQAQNNYTWDSSGANPGSTVDGSGNWDTTTADWSNGITDVAWPNTDYSNAIIGNGGAAGTITLQSAIVSNQLTLNPVSGAYIIAAAAGADTLGVKSITANNNANITASVIAGAGLTFGGAGTVTLSSAGTITGPVTLNGGTLVLGAAGVLNNTNSALTINSGATLEATNTAEVATLAGSGNLTLDSGSNLTIDAPVGSSSVFNGVISGAGTLTKLAVTPLTNTVSGNLTLTAADPNFTGKLALTGTTNNQVILSGNANINNAAIAVTNTTTTGSGPELSLSNLAAGLSAPINFTAGGGDYRFTINAAAGLASTPGSGTNNVVSSPINITFGTTSASTASIVFYSNIAGANLAVTSAITTNSGAYGQIVFRGSQPESFTGSINAATTTTVSTTDAGSVYFDPASGSKWGQITLGGTYTIEIPNDAALAGSTLANATNGLFFSGGKLQFQGTSSALNFVQANMNSTNAMNLSSAANNTVTYTGTIGLTGTNAINFVGPGNFILNGSSNGIGYTSGAGGTISITAGTVQSQIDNPFTTNATISLSSGATLNLTDTGGTDHNLEIKSLSGAGSVQTGASGNNTIQIDNAATTFSGVISGAGSIDLESGTQTLSGANTYSGATEIEGSGILALGNASALSPNTQLYIFGTGTFSIGSLAYTLENQIASSNSASSIAGTGVLTIDSDVNSQINSIIKTTGASVNFISTSGNGLLQLGGNSTYSGATNINSGTVQIGTNNNALPQNTAVTIASGATLDLNGYTQQVGSLAGTGTVQTNGGTLIDGETASSTFSGNITGSGSLAIAGGNGILTLATANTYTGPTILTSGTLLIDNDNEVNYGAGGFSFGTGQLKLMNYTSNLSFNSGNVILGAQSGAASTLAGSITGGASLTAAGPGTLILTSTGNNYTGGTTITGGNLQFAAGAFPAGTTITPQGAGALNITGAFSTVTGALPSISTGSTGVVALMGDSSENIDFTANGGYAGLYLGAAAAANYTGTITPAGGNYNLGGGGATLTLPNNNALTGANGLNVANSTVVLTGTNNLSGNINLNSGTLSINSDAAINNGGAGINFNGGTLQLANYSSNLSFNNITNLKLGATGTSTLNGTITGTSALNYQGPGTLLLGSSVVLPTTSALTVSAGTLDLNGTTQTVSSITGAGTINIPAALMPPATASTLTTTGAVSSTFAGNISGGGTLAINNSSNPTTATTLTFTGANAFTGVVNFTQSNITTTAGIAFSGNGSFNSASAINIIDSGGGGSFYPTIYLSSLAAPMTPQINLDYYASNNRIFITNTAGASTLSSPINFAAGSVNGGNLSFYSNAGTLTVSSAINVTNATFGITFRGTGSGVEGIFNGSITDSNPSGLTIAKTDPNTWVLDPAAGSTWGVTTLGNGTFEMGAANVMPPAAPLNMSGTSTMDLYGYSQTVGGLTSAAGSEIVTSTKGAATLTINAPASTATKPDQFSTASSDAISGPLTVTIAGDPASIEIFGNNTNSTSNNANTYTGGTNLVSGTLEFYNINNLGSGPITFNGGTLAYLGTDTGDASNNGMVVNSGGGTVNLGTNSVTFGKAVTGTGTLTKTGTGTLTFSLPVSLGGLTITGAGHLAGATNTLTGALTTTGTGTTVIDGATTAGSVAINAGSILQANGGLTAGTLGGDGTGTLQIGANSMVAATAQNLSTLNVAALTIGTGGVLDLGNGNLAVNYGAGTDPLSTIVSYIKNGYDKGNWDGISPVSGAIISSASIGKATALGYADTGTAVDVKYTWYGDLDLSGTVDSGDLTAMNSGNGSSWSQGDLNYDGVKNADDWSLFMYGAASQNGSISAGVPEPTTAALALLPLLGGLASRRRRQS
ncbi:MAG TPA: autotransporter-associated beta strand repeat-containing protein [Tepidisphaeraceae bacterium]